MTRLLTLLITCLLLACQKAQPPSTETVDTRTPIAVQYVGASKAEVRKTANDDAEVIATYPNGEAVSVLARQGQWTEIRTGDRSGWARSADLLDATAANAQANDTTVRFRRPPMPVAANGARGEIHLEASVNSDGDVVDVKVVTNTTGSQTLLERNIDALRRAQFEPMMQKGERKGFTYDHRATY
jgi:TonB family protein